MKTSTLKQGIPKKWEKEALTVWVNVTHQYEKLLKLILDELALSQNHMFMSFAAKEQATP